MRNYWRFKFALIPAGVLLAGIIFYYLWNALVPELFHGPVLNAWQAIGVLVIARMLFGTFRGGRGCCCGHHHHHGHRHWKERFDEKLAQMTPEEREKFKRKFYYRCCGSEWEKEDNAGEGK